MVLKQHYISIKQKITQMPPAAFGILKSDLEQKEQMIASLFPSPLLTLNVSAQCSKRAASFSKAMG